MWFSAFIATDLAFFDTRLLGEVTLLNPCTAVPEVLVSGPYKKFQPLFCLYLDVLCPSFRHIPQNGAHSIKVISARSRSPDSSAVMLSFINIPDLLWARPSDDNLYFRPSSSSGILFSNDGELDPRRLPCRDELFSIFMTCSLRVIILRQSPRYLDFVEFIVLLHCDHPCRFSREAALYPNSSREVCSCSARQWWSVS